MFEPSLSRDVEKPIDTYGLLFCCPSFRLSNALTINDAVTSRFCLIVLGYSKYCRISHCSIFEPLNFAHYATSETSYMVSLKSIKLVDM